MSEVCQLNLCNGFRKLTEFSSLRCEEQEKCSFIMWRCRLFVGKFRPNSVIYD